MFPNNLDESRELWGGGQAAFGNFQSFKPLKKRKSSKGRIGAVPKLYIDMEWLNCGFGHQKSPFLYLENGAIFGPFPPPLLLFLLFFLRLFLFLRRPFPLGSAVPAQTGVGRADAAIGGGRRRG